MDKEITLDTYGMSGPDERLDEETVSAVLARNDAGEAQGEEEDAESEEASIELEQLDEKEQEDARTLGGLDDDIDTPADEPQSTTVSDTAPEETDSARVEKITVVGVRFRTAGRVYYFSPGKLSLRRGMNVIVETARGTEFGTVVTMPMELPRRQVRSPLRTIIRIATTADRDREERNRQKEAEAYRVCQDGIRRHHLDMKLIQAEYTFDGNKILFYFTADQRVDFRDLVKDLAGIFHTRIELRQIGVRDETKILGGYGTCGRPLCCHTYLSDFVPVSIKMAKEQNLSLNPTKISGVCGRLMCCLKNEEETYEELNKTLPRIGDEVEAADGIHGEVESVNVLRQRVRIIVEANDEKELHEYEAGDLTIVRRRKRGQAKPKFRREEGSSNNTVTSHIKEAVEKKQKALAEEAATLHAAARDATEDGRNTDGRSPDSDGTRRNQRRDRTSRRGRNNRNADTKGARQTQGRTLQGAAQTAPEGAAPAASDPNTQARGQGQHRGNRRGHGRGGHRPDQGNASRPKQGAGTGRKNQQES